MAVADADAGLNLNEVPVKALQPSTKELISTLLNPLKVLPTDDGLPRDWRGLAQLTELRGDAIPMVSASPDPTAKVLSLWGGSLGLLQELLGRLDRWDVVDDSATMMERDAIMYKEGLERASTSALVLDEDIDKQILTKDDVTRLDQGLDPQHYSAYLLYADEDVDFAMKIVTEMETKYKLKLCLRDRDLVGGHMFEHEAIMKLISERCNRLIVVVSPSFLKSEANKFFVTFAQALGIDQRRRKVIPVMYERCPLPPELSYYFPLDYARSGHLWDFWKKLNDSIQTPNVRNRDKSSSSASLSTNSTCTLKVVPKPESAPLLTDYCNFEKPDSSYTDVSEEKLVSYTDISEKLSSVNIQSKSTILNPLVSKKSFSGSLESLKGKTLRLFTDFLPLSHGKKKSKKVAKAYEC